MALDSASDSDSESPGRLGEVHLAEHAVNTLGCNLHATGAMRRAPIPVTELVVLMLILCVSGMRAGSTSQGGYRPSLFAMSFKLKGQQS